jgi:hypothetical protein
MARTGRLSIRVTGSLLASVALMAASPVPASAIKHKAPPVISVTVTTDGGFSLPSKVHSGPVTFRFSTPENAFHAIQGFYLLPGATLDQVYEDFTNALSGVPELVVEGMAGLNAHIVEIGGAVTSPLAAQEVTIPMQKGTTYWLDLADVGVVSPPRTHVLRAHGHYKHARLPAFSAVFEATMDGHTPVIRGPSRFPHDGTFLGVVTGDELHEIVFRPVRTDITVTDAYISSWYDFVAGRTPTPPPFGTPWAGRQAGLQSLSPGRWAITKINLPPGRYAAICFTPSDELPGLPHAWTGMHQIVTLT